MCSSLLCSGRTGISVIFIVIDKQFPVVGGFGPVGEVLVFEDFELDHFGGRKEGRMLRASNGDSWSNCRLDL